MRKRKPRSGLEEREQILKKRETKVEQELETEREKSKLMRACKRKKLKLKEKTGSAKTRVNKEVKKLYRKFRQ